MESKGWANTYTELNTDLVRGYPLEGAGINSKICVSATSTKANSPVCYDMQICKCNHYVSVIRNKFCSFCHRHLCYN